ncbi:amino-acid N-acetyltransferase [Candidatus Kinetoplastidibacterium crithidiae]|uniref:Amino-acid acetyltransferase n=1 Tax=Candidatus Kinetoplastidibacterium crithidiae TCC036E TaxID=1208918 RepID=M1LTQ3_9PROT|nr:amino-acid N-acetyltransferase [Candidatus Kinetoplastibacterium crithidii]AFZ82476.1 N-acetylglutamate synthase [Candidatus Kinetoplastibacterium crithidii (ex Angomonas deanei ATCC 30255)]AGF47486.1 amino-acid N-acetyltransferase [Candidatus Kinetoplastibacterium crithidii TCC036E]
MEIDTSSVEEHENSKSQFVRWFREVAPYVHAFRGKTFVVAFGGELIQDGVLNTLVQDLSLLSALGIRLVLVYGSGPQINEQLRLKGLPQNFNNGIVIPTNTAALECAKEAAGEIRLDIEASFSQGLPNTPMSHSQIKVISGNFITASPVGVLNGIDFQLTGKVRKIDTEAIKFAIEKGTSVVLLSPIGFSPTGDAFHLEMEELATSTAIAIGAEKLIFLSSSEGVKNADGSINPEIARAKAETLLQDNNIDTTTTKFLKNSVMAVKKGVARTHILPYGIDGSVLLEIFTHGGIGTMVVEDNLDDLREASIDDVGAIISLIEPLESDGTLVPRPKSLIERDLEKFTVLEHDGVIYGCAALYPFPIEKMAELACLIVHPEWQSSGEGELLLRHIESRAKKMKIDRLFALTTRTSHWFLKRGFVRGSVKDLPKEKQINYNRSRNSLIFIKNMK